MNSSKYSTWTLLVFVAVMGFGITANADATVREGAAEAFKANHAGASFVSDKDTNRFYIVSNFNAKPFKGALEQGTRVFLENNAALFGLSGADSEIVFRKTVSYLDNRTVRFEQTIDGLPVFETTISVMVDGSRSVVRATSKALALQPRNWVPVLDSVQAWDVATDGVRVTKDGPVILGYFPVQGRPVLAYKVISPAAGPHIWVSYVDAVSGSIIARYDYLRHHEAELYEESPTVTPDLTKYTLENISSDDEFKNHTYGEWARAASCDLMSQTGGCDSWRYDAEAVDGNGFLDVKPILNSNPIEDDGFAELMVYRVIDMQNQWYRNEFGFDGGWFDSGEFDESATLVEADFLWIFVNAEYANGHFMGGIDYPDYEAPAAIVLGNISGKDLAYDNDVVAHEFQHAVSSAAFSMGMGDLDEHGINATAQAIEEGNADYFACTTMGNPILGEYSGVTRNLENDFTCPASIQGEGHHDGQTSAGAMWKIRGEIGKDKADHLNYGAMTSGTVTTFADYANALVTHAEWMANPASDLDDDLRLTSDDVQFVEDTLEERNLFDCKRFVPLVEGANPLLHYMQYGLGLKGTPSPVQYVVEVGDDVKSFEINIAAMGDRNFDVLMRKGEPILFEWSGSSYMDFSWEADYDAEVLYDAVEDEAVDSVVVSESSELAIEPNTSYYFSLVCRPDMYSGLGGCKNLLTLDVEHGEAGSDGDADGDADADGGADADTDSDIDGDGGVDPGTNDGGTDDDDEDDDGCGCRVSIGANPESTDLIGVVAALFI